MNSLRAGLRSIVKPIATECWRIGWRIRELKVFLRNWHSFTLADAGLGSDFVTVQPSFPCLDDRRSQSGIAAGHYFHQDLLVAQLIHDANPDRHVDIGSRVDGFVAHVAAFRQIDVIDIRPNRSRVRNVNFIEGDLLDLDLSVLGLSDSVSCLHALEHFGLGRYGDPVDPAAWRRGLSALSTLTADGGTLYLSVPIGPQRIEFDAHRVFAVPFLRQELLRVFDIVGFWYVDDDGDLKFPDLMQLEIDQTSFGCRYGCGIFELKKRVGSEV